VMFGRPTSSLVTLVLVGLVWLGAAPALAQSKAKAKGGGKSTGGTAMNTGSVELGIDGLVDVDSDDETAVYFDVTLGYFFSQGYEIGLQTLQGTTRTGQRDTSGVFGEYNWINGTKLVPFGGLAVKHAAAPTGEDQKAAKIGALYGGSKFMAASNAALALTFVWEFADHSVLGPEGARKRRNRELNLGFKFYF
jgi:hypothetical protein